MYESICLCLPRSLSSCPNLSLSLSLSLSLIKETYRISSKPLCLNVGVEKNNRRVENIFTFYYDNQFCRKK